MIRLKYCIPVIFLGFLSCTSNEEIDSLAPELVSERDATLSLIKDFGISHGSPNTAKSTKNGDIYVKDIKSKVYVFNISDSISGSSVLAMNKRNLSEDSVTLYTIEFEKEGVSGFSIATGDDRINRVYAYAEYGQLSDTIYNMGLKATLQGIEYACKQDLIRYYKEGVSTKAAPPIGLGMLVLPITQLKWDQSSPYNLLMGQACSGIEWYYNGRYPAGCGAIAVAQAVAYLCPPTIASYNLSGLRKVVLYPEGATTGDLSSNMSVFIKYIGGCLNTKYACSGSGAVIKDIRDEFNTWGIQYSFGEDVNIDLERLVYNLHSGLPHITSGFTKNPREGHAWIWEGVDCQYSGMSFMEGRVFLVPGTSPSLYCNWGWGGRSNGWYVNFETPLNQGTFLDDNCQLYITGTNFTIPN